eukprot:165393_1
MGSIVVVAFTCVLIKLSQQQTLYDASLQFHILNLSYPMKTYGGIAAIFNNSLYGFSGFYCETSLLSSCGEFTKYIQFTLDISSIHINNNSNEIYFTNPVSWIDSRITTTKINEIHVGTGTSSSTYLNEYAWVMHPGCCTEPTQVALKYSLTDNKYINQTEYHSIIPGETLSDSCNTNDGKTYIYSIGGRNGKQSIVSNKVYRYHIFFNLWEQLSDLNIARYASSCTFVNNELYVLGGSGVVIGSKLKTIEIYTNKQWNIIKTTLHTERNHHISITHPNNWIITIGGRDENNNAAVTEIFNPLTEMIAITETYSRKQFFHAVYEYDINTYIVFLFGGNFNGNVFDDVQYIVLSSDDQIISTFTSTMLPTVGIHTTGLGIDDSVSFNIPIGTLMIILICIGVFLLIVCILILIFMICSKKNNSRRKSRIHLEKLPKSSKVKSPKIKRNRFVSRLEGVQRKSSEGIRKHAIDEETNQYIDNDNEMNKLIVNYKQNEEEVDLIGSGSEQDDSSIEKMYVVSVDDDDDMKITPKNTRTPTYSLDGENVNEYEEEKGYDWICNTLKKCDKKHWKMYLKNFKKNKITERILIDLKDDAVWRELIPELGIRVQFQQLWKERKMRKKYAKTTGGNV